MSELPYNYGMGERKLRSFFSVLKKREPPRTNRIERTERIEQMERMQGMTMQKFQQQKAYNSKLPLQKTWLDRITDESNLWSNANLMDETGNFFEAFLLYLKDASECLKQGSLVRTALSCSCAANCLANMGYPSEARRLYLEAAMLYEENADSVIAESIRESLWCWEEAYGYYLLASDMDRAEKVFHKYVRLVRRVNPFLGEEAIQSLRNKKKATGVTQIIPSANVQVSKITKAIEDFLLSKGHAQISTNSTSDSSTITSRKSVKFEIEKVVVRISKMYDDMINFYRHRKQHVKITEVIDNENK